jgi:membrane protein
MAVMLLIYVMVFTAIFRFVPDAKVAWSDAAFGGLVTGVAFLVGRNAIGAYLGSQNLTTMYGAGGSVIVMLLWVYYCALLVLIGAEFTQVWGKHWGENPVPLEGAVSVPNKSGECQDSEQRFVPT